MRRLALGTAFVLATMAAQDVSAATIELGVTVRDFCMSGLGGCAGATNTDFRNAAYGNNVGQMFNGLDSGAVMSTLGADGKPVFNAAGARNPATGSSSFSNATNFNQWYNNAATNQTFARTLTLTNSVGNPNVYTFDSGAAGYFPVDGVGYGNQGQ